MELGVEYAQEPLPPRDATDWPENAVWDTQHGFQREPGFKVDGVVGQLSVLVVECSSDRHPTPKRRVVMLLTGPEQTWLMRCHDWVGICRDRGKMIVHDRWSLGRSLLDRFRDLCIRTLAVLEKDTVGKILDIFRCAR